MKRKLSNTNASNSKTVELASYDKICVMPALEQIEEFLKSAFTPMENKDRRKLQQQFIVLDTPFTTPPHIDMMIAGEYSKSTKATDNLYLHIQVHFLDAVGILTGILEALI